MSADILTNLRRLYRKAMPLRARENLWKVFARTLHLTRFSLGRMVSVFLLLLSPVVLIRIGWMTRDRIGHMVESAEVYLRLHRHQRLSRRQVDLIFIVTPTPPANEVMWEHLENHLPLCRYAFLHRFIKFVRPGIVHNRNFIELNDSKNFYIALRKPHVFTLSKADMKRGARALEALGMTPSDWHVCVANRDPAYLDTVSSGRNWQYHNYRDSSVANLVGAAKEVAARGGYTFRMGHSAKQAWPQNHGSNVIDFASGKYDPFLDVFLSATCRFYIANNNGINVLPLAFGRRIACANIIPLTRLSPLGGGFTIPKLFRDPATRELIHFRELKKKGLFDLQTERSLYFTETYNQLDVDIVENDAEDIAGLCRDMFAYDAPSAVPKDIQELQQYYEREYLGLENPYIGAPLAPSFIIRHRHLIV